jgi:exopolysaccharide production protein ExoZ
MYKSIQGCRAVAALLVVLYHLGIAVASRKYFGASLFAVPFTAGDSGVEFFFVLSGFIITWAHFDEFGDPPALTRYMRKRMVRIYPIFWIVFAAVYLLSQLSPSLRSTLPHDCPTLLKSLALWPQDRSVGGGTGAPVLIVAWSLQYEVCFYVLMGIFIVSRPLGLLLSLVLWLNVWTCRTGACSFPRSFFANNLVILFGLGVLIAYCGKRSLRIGQPKLVGLIAAGAFVLYGVFEAATGAQSPFIDRRLIYGLLSGVIIYALVQSEDGGHLKIGNRWLPLLGDSSYALYLIHYPLISVMCKCMIFIGLSGNAGAAVAYPVVLCSCVFASVGFHLWVERPILRVLSGHRASTVFAPGMP